MNRPSRPVSMADVARLANVSVPTVSRVMTGAARVSPDKATRVEDAIKQLGYRPNGAARALVHGAQNTIVVLTGNTTYYGYAATIQGIEEAARADGTMVVIAVIESDQDDDVQAAIGLALSQPVAGIIVLTFDRPGEAVLRHLPQDVAVALASGRPNATRPQALIDEFGGGRAATRHLLELGHTTVHHVSIPPSVSGEDLRTAGWRAALTAAGAVVPDVIPGSFEARSGIEIGRRLAARPEVTAIFCGNDELAMGLIRGLVDAGRRVPEDVSVVGFDDHPFAELWSPPLTTVVQDFGHIGRRSYDLLLEAMGGDDAEGDHVQPTELVVRRSTAPPR
ncbi:LacI family DNA-binding transcriptional regulator [uncultured Amnibacterium sp.]|uniref:LacI family DNA-binding transcriptional regulator n=1 Tax=uncultured Amnibacterium sp. TaxID=1631851 RepID=UPI0035CAB310